jgi:hypothetical protein
MRDRGVLTDDVIHNQAYDGVIYKEAYKWCKQNNDAVETPPPVVRQT